MIKHEITKKKKITEDFQQTGEERRQGRKEGSIIQRTLDKETKEKRVFEMKINNLSKKQHQQGRAAIPPR
jgi:hypothetical protein